MTLKSVGNEVFLYHTPRDRPMSRHPLLLRDLATTRGQKTEVAECTIDDEDQDFRRGDAVSAENKLQAVLTEKSNPATIKKGTTLMRGNKPLPKFLPPMCRTYIDLLKSSNNKDRQNITSKAQSEKLAKLSQVERGC